MKKIKKILLSLLIAVTLVSLFGCSIKEKCELNCERSVDHKYDFINFIDVSLYGSEGYGFIEVKPKEITVNDFESEEEYIAVKKILDTLSLYCNITSEKTSLLSVEPNEGLKNGDIVTFSINLGNLDLNNVDINIEPYQVKITTLPDPIELNIFDDTSVLFYGLEGTTEIGYIKIDNGNIPSEILDNIEYKITENKEIVSKDSTVFSVEAVLNEEYAKENNYKDITDFLGKKGYLPKTTAEKVLRTVITPIDFTNANNFEVSQAILGYLNNHSTAIENNNYELKDLATVQQYKEEAIGYKPFTYFATFTARKNENDVCLRVPFKMVKVNDEVEVLEPTNGFSIEIVEKNKCLSEIENSNLLIDYGITFNETVTEQQSQ